jgi:hypothetical protein
LHRARKRLADLANPRRPPTSPPTQSLPGTSTLPTVPQETGCPVLALLIGSGRRDEIGIALTDWRGWRRRVRSLQSLQSLQSYEFRSSRLVLSGLVWSCLATPRISHVGYACTA